MGIDKSNIANLTLLLFTIGLCLISSEFFIAKFFPQFPNRVTLFQPDEQLGWSFIPNKSDRVTFYDEADHEVSINEIGFRDSTYEHDSKSKVLVIGDSFVSNLSVPDNAVFTEVLESKYDSTLIINAGVNGYGQVQELLLLETLIPKIDPDLIILQIYLRNDFVDNLDGKWTYPRPRLEESEDLEYVIVLPSAEDFKQAERKKEKSLIKELHLYALIRKFYHQVKHTIFPSEKQSRLLPPELSYCNPNNERFEEELQAIEYLIDRLDQLSKNKDTEILYTVAPSIYQVEDNLWNQFTEQYTSEDVTLDRTYGSDRLLSIIGQKNIKSYDLFPALHQSSLRGKSPYFPKEQHWNSQGNRVVADSLHAYLSRNYPLH